MFYTKKEYMDVAEIQHRQTFQQKPGTPETKKKAMSKNKTLYQRRATGYEPRELDDGEGNLPNYYEKRLTSRVTEVRSTIDDINDNIVVQTDGSNNPAAKLEGNQRKTYYFNG